MKDDTKIDLMRKRNRSYFNFSSAFYTTELKVSCKSAFEVNVKLMTHPSHFYATE